MKKYLVNYTETFTGQIEVEADNEEMANNKVCGMIDSGKLNPAEKYDGHEVTVDFVREIEFNPLKVPLMEINKIMFGKEA